jgi:hypothetical protein
MLFKIKFYFGENLYEILKTLKEKRIKGLLFEKNKHLVTKIL